ncbi:YhgE/Pip domain-containing protein [Eggerthella lenta]|uniref:YhgE/Pip domain-containing protein n=1 Tax=Eggerthella lenta TaxID=84112 RepID=UPI000DF6DB27|nr:YhgE/Pip domain-containing protein [Eggerthella lenta]RDB91347.1 YhgE/Pip domain-containing protein [Eggerthella lenta]
MAFKGLRFAGLEWKNITASKIMWVVIAAIAIMPLLYGALYLAAFQDPYARLNTVPVAVVNEDKGAIIATEQRNIGDDVVQQLKDTDDGLGWHFVSADEAQKGLEDGEYFMTCTIPADFSESIASVDGSAPEKAQLKIDYNQSENMLASQIGETVWKEVRTRVSDTVAAEYWTTVLGRVADSGKDIQKAADGAGDLKDGLVAAHDGSVAITSNLGTLKDGALTLDTGLGSLVSGASSLDGGLGALAGGAFALKDGTQSLVAGASQLKDGAGQVAAGASDVAGGASKLQSDGTSKVAAGASELASKTAGLDAQAGQLNDGVQTVVGSMGDLVTALGSENDPQTLVGGSGALVGGLEGLANEQTGAPALAAGVGALSGSLGSLQAGASAASSSLASVDKAAIMASDMSSDDKEALLKAIGTAQAYLDGAGGQTGVVEGLGQAKYSTDTLLAPGAQKIADNAPTLLAGAQAVNGGLVQMRDSLVSKSSDLQDLSAGASQLAQAAPELVAGIGRVDAGANEVNANMSSLVAGSSKVASGASQVNDGASSAVSGANQLDDGAAQLVDGVQAAKNGAGQLVAGTQSAKDGSAQIASGAVQLEEGSGTLASGLTDAVDGSGELSTALADGAKTAAEQTTNIDGKSEVMSDPIELANEYYTTVKNYGTGFAPYFMALGLWVGGLVAGFVLKPLNSRLIMSGANPVTVAFSNYLPVAFFSLIQATLLMVVLQFGLQLQIDNVPAFYAMGYLTALVFAAIMQMLMAAFGFPGKFVAIILLMLQLTACAGTFPIQTTPDFFQVINPYMPMTYVVQGMRQIMTGLDYGIVGFDCFVLFAIGAACFALTCLVAYRKRTVRMEDLHPVLQLG